MGICEADLYLKDIDVCSEVSDEVPALDLVSGDLLDEDVGRRQDERDELVEVVLEQGLDVAKPTVEVAISGHPQACEQEIRSWVTALRTLLTPVRFSALDFSFNVAE